MVRGFCLILLYTALSCVTLQELQNKAAYKAENCLFLQQLQDEAASEAEMEVWGRFGSLLEVLGAFWESLGGPLGVSGGLLEPSWGALWTLLGTFWGAWRAQDDLLGPLGRHLEASWDTPRKSCEKKTILDLKNRAGDHSFGGPEITK